MSLRSPVQHTEVSQSTPAEVKSSDSPSLVEGEMTPNLWEQTNKKPYLTKVWDSTEAWEVLSPDEQGNAELISEYFNESKDFRKDEVGYKDYLKKFEHLTNTKSAPIQVKIKKISEFIRYLQRTKNI